MCQPPPWARAPWVAHADSEQAGGASGLQPTLRARLRAAQPPPPPAAAGTQPRPEEPAPAGAPPRPGSHARTWGEDPGWDGDEGGLPKRTKGPGNSRAAQAPKEGAPRDAQETPWEAAPGRVPGRGWWGGAGSDQLRTARTAQRRRGDREQPGQWPKSSTFEGGDGGDWGTVPRILLAAAASPAASQPQTPRGSPTLIQASGPVGLAPRLRPDSLSRGPPGQPHQG